MYKPENMSLARELIELQLSLVLTYPSRGFSGAIPLSNTFFRPKFATLWYKQVSLHGKGQSSSSKE